MSTIVRSPTTPPSALPDRRATPPRLNAALGNASRKQPGSGGMLFKLIAVAGIVVAAGWGVRQWTHREPPPAAEVTAVVLRGTLPVSVTERGEIGSSKTVDVRCEVEGEQTKITEIVPEGTHVTAGEVVVRFDTEKLARSLAEQEVKWRNAAAKAAESEEELAIGKNKAESEIAKATLEVKLAKLDLRKYLEGDYLQDKRQIEGDILLADEELRRAKERVEFSERLSKKGYVSDSEVETDRVAVLKSQNTANVAKEKLRVLDEFSRERSIAELTSRADETVRELERTKRSQASTVAKLESTFRGARDTTTIEKQQLDRLKLQLERCVVTAPQDGILVYSNYRFWDPNARIRAGGFVYFQQSLFSLPDLTQMEVKVKVHESAVKKVKPDQWAEIRVDAYAKAVLRGVVVKVATLADSRGPWDQRGVKEYETVLRIDNLPDDAGLKPGMTAEVKILVSELTDVLSVPVQAVAERDGRHFAYVIAGAAVDRRPVEVGETNDKFVEIVSGLNESERVALDARARLTAESGGKEKSNGAKPEPPAAAKSLLVPPGDAGA